MGAVEASTGFGGDVIEDAAHLAEEFAVEAAQFDAFDAVVFEAKGFDIDDPEGFVGVSEG